MLTNIGQEVERLLLQLVRERDANKRAGIAFMLKSRLKTLDSAASLFLDYKDISDKQAEIIETVKSLGLTIAIDGAPLGAEGLKDDE